MKALGIIAKIIAALSAAVGAIVLLSAYGDKIVAWCKQVVQFIPDEDEVEEAAEEVPAEEAPAEEAPAEEAPVEEAPAEEAPVEEAPVADDTDFE